MNTAGRLGLYGAGLAAAFAVAFGAAGLVAPREAAAEAAKHEQSTQQEEKGMNGHDAHGTAVQEAVDHGAHTATETTAGVSLASDGYALAPVSAPVAVGEQGRLSFRILDGSGAAVTDYTPQHEKDLHLIVVRSDGAQFRHVHPTLDASTGTWSIPWTWSAAGSYRVFADFAAAGADPVTLTRTVDVAGSFTPVVAETSTRTSVDGLEVAIAGDLVAGSPSELTVTVRRDGAPVTTLQPYLGAFGHLVALREGDLAYLHVHPEGAAPAGAEATSGPDVRFGAHVPTAGRYLLYFDFQIDGSVHTAAFVLEAADGAAKAPYQH
ncbi:heavy metal-binding domain-containing protein [Microbacterium sp. MYb64]|uniref:heavy metal-binding domain-containing protein n=1 Tax=Microbacterium sp. MYb64 TaxID=1848691 RepID=UPI000CFD7BF5|nr:heavy metal-binding domain-containing protein [Microbacterium sp. MYb64]PRB06370.1 heavy metal-binding domain-containing protein [Microbacterium sp. MYb64]